MPGGKGGGSKPVYLTPDVELCGNVVRAKCPELPMGFKPYREPLSKGVIPAEQYLQKNLEDRLESAENWGSFWFVMAMLGVAVSITVYLWK